MGSISQEKHTPGAKSGVLKQSILLLPNPGSGQDVPKDALFLTLWSFDGRVAFLDHNYYTQFLKKTRSFENNENPTFSFYRKIQ